MSDFTRNGCPTCPGTRKTLIRLKNNVHIAAYPCRPEALRGLRARIVVCDELAFFRTSEYRPVDKEMLRAIRPMLATTGGRLIILSSPYGQAGALFDLHRKHYGIDKSPILVWQGSAPEMNPTLNPDYLDRMREEDPEAYRSEVEGMFRAGLGLLFDPEVLDRCVVEGRTELPYVPGTHYKCFVDPSGGRRDAFALAIGHLEGPGHGERVVVDLCRSWPAPHNPAEVARQVAQLVRHYGCWDVTGDRYGGNWVSEAFKHFGNMGYKTCELPKSELYLNLLSTVNSGRIDLPEDKELLREMRGLERRTSAQGKDSVDHSSSPGARDDKANAIAGLSHELLRRKGNFVTIHKLRGL